MEMLVFVLEVQIVLVEAGVRVGEGAGVGIAVGIGVVAGAQAATSIARTISWQIRLFPSDKVEIIIARD